METCFPFPLLCPPLAPSNQCHPQASADTSSPLSPEAVLSGCGSLCGRETRHRRVPCETWVLVTPFPPGQGGKLRNRRASRGFRVIPPRSPENWSVVFMSLPSPPLPRVHLGNEPRAWISSRSRPGKREATTCVNHTFATIVQLLPELEMSPSYLGVQAPPSGDRLPAAPVGGQAAAHQSVLGTFAFSLKCC